MKGRILITEEHLSADEALRVISSEEAGGYVIFLGKVREKEKGYPKVLKLIYEAYDEMAVKEMERIRREAMERFPVKDVIIWHRKGELKVEEETMLIAVAAPHRKEAFEACEWIVDEVKRRVPVWKKEVTERGSFWVEGDRRIPSRNDP